MRKYIIIGLALVMGSLTSCSLDPTLADSHEIDMEDDISMRQFIDGAYNTMARSEYMGRNYIIAGEIRADNVYSNGNSGRFTLMSAMNLQSTDGDVTDIFRYAYATISNPNVVIATDLSTVEGSEANKAHILGEAYAIRAMAHFDLLRLYGQQYIDNGSNLGITYAKEYKAEDLQIPRSSVEDNKIDIYADIEKAIDYMLQGESSEWANNKTNFTLDAVLALKTRVGTYFKEYDIVEDAASQLEGKYEITPANKLVEYWSDSNPGAASIFELAQSTTDNAGINGLAYIYRGDSYGDVQAFNNLIEDAEFDSDDVRASEDMIGYESEDSNKLRNLGKYPSGGDRLGSDNIKLFRYEEVVLNYAEAVLETNPNKALELLNDLAENRNASEYDASDVTLENIIKERRKELMFEGFRFHDLARHGLDIPEVDPNTSNNHGLVPAGDNRFAFPIPRREINTNKSVEQNPGY